MGLATLRRRPPLLTECKINSRILQKSVRILVLIAILKIKIPRTSLGIIYFLERAMGLEPTTAAMARRYSSQLSYAREQLYYIYFSKNARKKKRVFFLLPLSSFSIYYSLWHAENHLLFTGHSSRMNSRTSSHEEYLWRSPSSCFSQIVNPLL